MRKYLISLSCALLVGLAGPVCVMADYSSSIKGGNKAYKSGDYEAALESYQRAYDEKPNKKLRKFIAALEAKIERLEATKPKVKAKKERSRAAGEGKWDVVVGMASVPATWHYREMSGRITWFPFDIEEKYAQKKEDFRFTGMGVRVSRMQVVALNENLLAGIESGLGLITSGTTLTTDIAVLEGLTTDEFTFKGTASLSPASAFSTIFKAEVEGAVFPVLGKLLYRIPTGGNLSLGVGLGIGAYIINCIYRETETRTYVSDVGPNIKEGDVLKSVYEDNFCVVAPGGEMQLSMSLPVMDGNLVIGGGLSIGKMAKRRPRQYLEDQDYRPGDWDSILAPDYDAWQNMTLTDGLEIGGMTYAGGLSISLPH